MNLRCARNEAERPHVQYAVERKQSAMSVRSVHTFHFQYDLSDNPTKFEVSDIPGFESRLNITLTLTVMRKSRLY